jgi:hypothetical protein
MLEEPYVLAYVFHLFQSDWLHLMQPNAVEDIDQCLSDGRYLPTRVVYIFAIEVCANCAIRLDLALYHLSLRESS